jgi:hypothetical protein
MNRIFNYIKGNKTGTSILAVVIACILGLAFASGCGSLDDMVKVNVPEQVQQATHSKGTIPLSNAIHVRRQYVTEVKFALDKFDENIEGATAFRDLALSLLNTGMVAGQGALAGFPGGAVLMSLLAGVGGLYLKKPGTDAEINAAKEDSFNAGQKKAKDLLAQAAIAAVTEATGAHNAS